MVVTGLGQHPYGTTGFFHDTFRTTSNCGVKATIHMYTPKMNRSVYLPEVYTFVAPRGHTQQPPPPRAQLAKDWQEWNGCSKGLQAAVDGWETASKS